MLSTFTRTLRTGSRFSIPIVKRIHTENFYQTKHDIKEIIKDADLNNFINYYKNNPYLKPLESKGKIEHRIKIEKDDKFYNFARLTFSWSLNTTSIYLTKSYNVIFDLYNTHEYFFPSFLLVFGHYALYESAYLYYYPEIEEANMKIDNLYEMEYYINRNKY